MAPPLSDVSPMIASMAMTLLLRSGRTFCFASPNRTALLTENLETEAPTNNPLEGERVLEVCLLGA